MKFPLIVALGMFIAPWGIDPAIPTYAVAESPTILVEPVPNIAEPTNSIGDNAGRFRRKPEPQPEPDVSDFQFIDIDVNDSSTPSDTTEVGFKDWDEEQWQNFFDKVARLASVLIAAFGGFSASNSGGFLNTLIGRVVRDAGK